MRRTAWASGLGGCLALSAGVQLIGCWPLDYSEPDMPAPPDAGPGDGGTPEVPECVPSRNPKPVEDACGLFVDAEASAGGTGTKSAPLQSLEAAIQAAASTNKQRIYLCAGQQVPAGVTLPGGIDLYGGVDCAQDWAYSGDQTTLTAAPNVVPLRIVGNANLRDLHILAPPGEEPVPGMEPGRSSIGMLVEGATVKLYQCVVEAQAGADGPNGENLGPGDTAESGIEGPDGAAACSLAEVQGGTGPTKTCGTQESVGGSGGDSVAAQGSPGTPGQPLITSNGGDADVGGGCGDGDPGGNGSRGNPGPGAQGNGTISSRGFEGTSGSTGLPGQPGQGGGGGGGSKGGFNVVNQCPDATRAGGAGGGAGGTGGCGGAGGGGGDWGGSSIAILSINANLSFEGVTLKTGAGGHGGAGGNGQRGGGGAPGGDGGTGRGVLQPGCRGGAGGTGGAGGKGGGGTGGHSIGIAYLGSDPVASGMPAIQQGQAGLGGLGGDARGNGQAGIQDFKVGFEP